MLLYICRYEVFETFNIYDLLTQLQALKCVQVGIRVWVSNEVESLAWSVLAKLFESGEPGWKTALLSIVDHSVDMVHWTKR